MAPIATTPIALSVRITREFSGLAGGRAHVARTADGRMVVNTSEGRERCETLAEAAGFRIFRAA